MSSSAEERETSDTASAAGQQSGQPSSSGQGPSPPRPDPALWRQRVAEWFPKWRERTYFVPSVLMYRTQAYIDTVSEQSVSVPVRPGPRLRKRGPSVLQESRVKADKTQQCVLHCLRELSEKQKDVMFVLSEFQFIDYLKGVSSSEATGALPTFEKNRRKGDFDLLLLHRYYGFLACEVKSVGLYFPQDKTEIAVISDVLKNAAKQLKKSKVTLAHFLSDRQHPPRMNFCLMLPNVTDAQLQGVLLSNEQLLQDLRDCLGNPEATDLVPLYLTSDKLSGVDTPYDVTDEVLVRLGQWWQLLMVAQGPDPHMTEDTYLDLLSRFVGPATTIQIFRPPSDKEGPDLRTEGELVSETGYRFGKFVLTEEQVSLLKNEQPLMFLVGPPGTGKTVMLLLRALHWLINGMHVDVVCTWNGSLAVSHFIVDQCKERTEVEKQQHIQLHTFDLHHASKKQIEDAAIELLTTRTRDQGQGLCIIADDIVCEFESFCNILREKVGGLKIWAAAFYHTSKPSLLTSFTMAQPLRTPPAVTREVEKSPIFTEGGRIPLYEQPSSPLPSDGPQPKCLYHREGHHGHTGNKLRDCKQCGLDVANFLTELHVNATVPGRSDESQLRYSDVIVLTYKHCLTDADGLVRGLVEGGMEVTVLKEGDDDAQSTLGTMSGPKKVVVALNSDVCGLERKIVVWVHADPDRDQSQTADDCYGRLYIASRCTAQLVKVMFYPGKSRGVRKCVLACILCTCVCLLFISFLTRV